MSGFKVIALCTPALEDTKLCTPAFGFTRLATLCAQGPSHATLRDSEPRHAKLCICVFKTDTKLCTPALADTKLCTPAFEFTRLATSNPPRSRGGWTQSRYTNRGTVGQRVCRRPRTCHGEWNERLCHEADRAQLTPCGTRAVDRQRGQPRRRRRQRHIIPFRHAPVRLEEISVR